MKAKHASLLFVNKTSLSTKPFFFFTLFECLKQIMLKVFSDNLLSFITTWIFLSNMFFTHWISLLTNITFYTLITMPTVIIVHHWLKNPWYLRHISAILKENSLVSAVWAPEGSVSSWSLFYFLRVSSLCCSHPLYKAYNFDLNANPLS